MSEDEKFQRIKQFVEGRIDSVEQLHVLILLRGDAKQSWTIPSISEELRSTPSSVEMRLRKLVDKKVLAENAFEGEKILYRPFSEETDQCVGELIDYFREKPYRVMDIIFSQPRDAIHTLANAFRFRKE